MAREVWAELEGCDEPVSISVASHVDAAAPYNASGSTRSGGW